MPVCRHIQSHGLWIQVFVLIFVLLYRQQIKKFKDALAKHSTDRCSLGPAKGLEENELLALAANKDLGFSYVPGTAPLESDVLPIHAHSESPSETAAPSKSNNIPLPLPLPLVRNYQDSGKKNLVNVER